MGPELQIGSVALFYGVLALVIILAFMRGGRPEKWGVAVILAMGAWQFSAYGLSPPKFERVDLISVISDAIGFVGFGLIALNAKRLWPIWASSLQLMSLAAHFARLANLDVEPLVYSLLKSTPTGIAIIAIAFGTILHQRRKARSGFDPCWQDWKALNS